MSFIQLQFRRGNASQWTSADPILADGELAIESDTRKFKIGNGSASWNILPYGGLVGPTGAIGDSVPNDISFNGNIFVGRDVLFGGKLTVRNDVSFNTELGVGGNVNIRRGVSVGGNVLLSSNLTVGVDASFNGNTSVAFLPYYSGNASVTPALNQLVTKKYVDENGGTILLDGNNTWTGNNTFNGSRFYVGGDASFNGNLVVRGDVSFNDNMSVQSDSSFNNRLYVGKQVGVGVSANALYALDVLGNINLTGSLFLNNKLFSITSADISLNANLSVGVDASFNGNVFVAKTLNFKKTVITGAATGSATSIVAATSIVEITGTDVNTAYFTLANGSYAGQTLTIISATNGGGGGLYVNSAGGTNIVFNGSNCSQMRFSNTFQTVNLIWSSTTSQWIVASWQGVNFSGVSMNFGTYALGDISLSAAGRVNITAGGNLVVGSDSSFNGNLSVGVGKSIGIGKMAGTNYALDVGGNINLTGNLYTNGVLFSAFDNSKDISLNANLSVAFDSSFNGNLFVGNRLIVNGDVSFNQRLTVGGADSSFNANLYIGRRLIGNGDVSFNQRLTVGGADSSFNGNLYVGNRFIVNGDVSLNQRLTVGGADSSFNGNLFVGTRMIVNSDVSFNQRLTVGGADSSFNGNLFVGNRLIVNGDVSLNQRLTVGGADSSFNSNLFVGNRLIVNGDMSLNQRLTVGGADSSFNGNLFVGGFLNVNGYVNADSYSEKFVNETSSSGAYTADFNNGLILYVNAFSGTSTPSLSIINLPMILNQSYVFTVVYSGAPTSTYFSSLDINGTSVPVNGTVSLTAATSYYIHQFCIFFTDATNISNNCVVQNFNSSAPLSLVSPSITGNLSVAGDINLTGGNIYQNGVLFSGGGGTVGPSLSLGGNLYVGGDISFGGKLFGNADVSLNQRLFVGGNLQVAGVIRTTLTTDSTSSITGALIVAGGAGIGGNVEVGGNVDIASTRSSTNSTTGALVVGGGIGVGGVVNIGNTTASSSTTTGALVVGGGVGIGGTINVGGNIDMRATNPLIRFSNQAVNKKLVLWDNGLNDDPTAIATTSFFGFGINNSALRYQASDLGHAHKFYSGSSINANGIIECGPIIADNITFRSNTKISQAITVSFSIDGTNFCKNGSFTLTSAGVWNVSILWQAAWSSTGASTPAAMFITTNSAATYTRPNAEALTDFKETATSTAVFTDNTFYHRLNTTLTITSSNLTWNVYLGKFNGSNVNGASLYLTATRIG
jgi:hypothetical protein